MFTELVFNINEPSAEQQHHLNILYRIKFRITILFYIYNLVVSFCYLFFSGDFEIIFRSVQKNTTIFELTAESFLTVCSEFCRVNSHTNLSYVKMLYSEFHAFHQEFNCFVFIVSIVTKFFSLCSKTKRTEKIWHKHFIEVCVDIHQ